ncbi:subtilisin-like protease SBT3 [Andrographis paniculata]|uniref:subtilisin-like protease SBT3 n=1 Tax=Andrographis paniculata TaxID=175694 RepID=UPI0021E92D93|nr:subtilisin-like protease SBT3 [Andrographis paniculata]
MKIFPRMILLPLWGFLILSDHRLQLVCAERSVYIVHMDRSLMPMVFSSHRHWYSSLLLSAQTSSDSDHTLKQKLIYVYQNAFHGFSALLSEHELEALNTAPGFISAYKNTPVSTETTRSVDFLSLSTAAGIWPASKYGKDVIIGVVDSGIWPESLSFRDDGIGKVPARWKGICQAGEQFNSSHCNRKLIGARYFNQGILAADPNITIPMNSARDIDGHGTHVASTAAGNFVSGVSYFGYAGGTARGVAPRARLAVYKVLWSVGGSGAADTLAGIDQAVADGVDILSISIGAGFDDFNLYQNSLSIASFGARQRGIIVCFSAGNRGPGTRTIRDKGIPWAVIVAAGTIDRWFAGKLTLGNGKSFTGWTLFPRQASIKNLPVVYNETLSACDSTLSELTEEAIIVCKTEPGSVFLDSTLLNVARSKAKAAIVIGEDPKIFRTTMFPHPATVVSLSEGQEVIDYATKGSSPTATIEFRQTIVGPGRKPAPALAEFSSRGPARSYEGILKPDVTAPGVLILAGNSPGVAAAAINETSLFSNYTLLWGTSMACPHVSGVAALLKAAHPDWSPSAIQSAMMTTAGQLDNAGHPIREEDGSPLYASPLGIGSGQVDPNRAMDPGLVYDNTPKDFVDLVCAMNFTANQTRTILRSNYNCSTPSSDLNYPSFVAVFQPPEEGRTLTRRFQRTVTNVGAGAATYSVRVEAPANTTVSVRPATLVFRRKYEKVKYSLSVRFVASLDEQHRPGSVTWIDRTGKYSVRSPIMVSAGADFFE